jgi:hypothetical protein
MHLHLPWPLLGAWPRAGAGLGGHGAGVGPLCAVGRAGARRQGGLVMRCCSGSCCWPPPAPSPRRRVAPVCRAARWPSRRLRRPSRLPHRVVVRDRLAETPDGKPLGFQVTFFRSRTEHDPANPSAFAPPSWSSATPPCPTRRWAAWCTTSAARAKASAWPGRTRRHRRQARRLAHAARRRRPLPGDGAFGRTVARAALAPTANRCCCRAKAAIRAKAPRPARQLLLQRAAAEGRRRSRLGRQQAAPDRRERHGLARPRMVQPGAADPEATGWDWTGINLDDGGALMAFQIRSKERW